MPAEAVPAASAGLSACAELSRKQRGPCARAEWFAYLRLASIRSSVDLCLTERIGLVSARFGRAAAPGCLH